jgi:hypothetical protein
MSYERKLAPDQPAANDPKYVVIELRARIAELEAHLKTAAEALTKEVEWREQAEAELQAQVEALADELVTSGDRLKRAEQAEAELAALIPVAGACPECGIDPSELAALKEQEATGVSFRVFDEVRGKWLHEKDRADDLEAELAASLASEKVKLDLTTQLLAELAALKAENERLKGPPPAWSGCPHDWDYTPNTGYSARCRKCGTTLPVKFNGSQTTCWTATPTPHQKTVDGVRQWMNRNTARAEEGGE